MAKMQLPRQDPYGTAREKAIRRFRETSDLERLTFLGVERREAGRLELPVLCWRFVVEAEPFSMVVAPEARPASLVWQVLALDYLNAPRPTAPAGFRSFADFAEGRTYLKVFEGRVIERLSRGVGADEAQFILAAERCSGTRGSHKPLSYLFRFFPRFEMEVVRHGADEDFPATCAVLFSDNAADVLSIECMVVAAERLVAALRGRNPWE